MYQETNCQRFKFLPSRAIGYRGRVWRQINFRQDRWEKQFLVLEDGTLSFYSDEQCSLRYDSLLLNNSYKIEARSDEYLGERFILKLTTSSERDSSFQWSVTTKEEQASWVEVISNDITGTFPIIKQSEIWSNFTSSCLVLMAFKSVDKEVRVCDGNYIPISLMVSPPVMSLRFSSKEKHPPNSLYTLIMLDMDFSSSSECSPRQYLLWAKVNISNGDGSDGQEWISYQSPNSSDKSMEAHRIFFILMMQEGRLSTSATVARDHFQMAQFAKVYSLLLPVGINGCFASNQQNAVNSRLPSRTDSNISNNSSLNLNEVDNSGIIPGNNFIEVNNISKQSLCCTSHAENSYMYHVEECDDDDSLQNTPRRLISVLKTPGSKSSHKKSVSFKLDESSLPIKAPFNVSIELMLDVYAEEDDDNQPDYEIRKFAAENSLNDDPDSAGFNFFDDQTKSSEFSPSNLKIPIENNGDNFRIFAGSTPRAIKALQLKNSSSRNANFVNIANGRASPYNSWIETSPAFINLSFSEKLKRLQRPQDMCAFFQVESTSIFIGEIVQKKFCSDFLFKDSFVWVNLAKQSLHWAKSSIHKSDPKKQKYVMLQKNSNLDFTKVEGCCKGFAVGVTQENNKLIVTLDDKKTLKIKGLVKAKIDQWLFVIDSIIHQNINHSDVVSSQ